MSQRPCADPTPFAAIARQGRSALAWEILRRDPAYRAAYRDLPVFARGQVAGLRFVSRWGLHFP